MPVPERAETSARLITASGNINISREQAFSDTLQNAWDDLLTCVKYINQDAFLRSQTGQIYIGDESLYLLIPVIGNHIIIFGEPENTENQLERLKIFYKQGMDEEKWKTYVSLDLRYKNQIICKK
jgi:cell division protein FtsQ